MTWRERLTRLAREPLLHFLGAGALVFMIWGGGADPGDRIITVDQAQVRGLVEQWQATWRRPPTPAEIDGMIREHVKDEVYYREALRMGMDRDDVVVRRRMRSKMEFLVAAQAENETPSQSDLQAWLDAHRTDYAAAARLSFDQAYAGQDAARAHTIGAALANGADADAVALPLGVPARIDDTPADEIDRMFGDGFAKGVAALPPGRWGGPLTSGFGLHFVRLRLRVPGATPPLASVRKAVENDWREARRADREARAYQALLDGYSIRIAKP